jgi:hypothetical protein
MRFQLQRRFFVTAPLVFLFLLTGLCRADVGTADDLKFTWSRCFQNSLKSDDQPAIQCVAIGVTSPKPESGTILLAIRFQYSDGEVRSFFVAPLRLDTARGLDDPDQHAVFTSHILAEINNELGARDIFVYFTRWDQSGGQTIESIEGTAPTGQKFKIDHPKFPFRLFN